MDEKNSKLAIDQNHFLYQAKKKFFFLLYIWAF